MPIALSPPAETNYRKKKEIYICYIYVYVCEVGGTIGVS